MLNSIPNEMGDTELVIKALKDPNDFAKIVQRYQSPIRRYVARLGCRDTHDADDLLQDIFLKVYVNLNDYEIDLKFSSWLYRIAHNETISFFRKKNIRPAPVTTEEEVRLLENIADQTDFTESLNKKMDADLLREAIAKLEEQYRAVIVLKFLEDKSYTEISDILKIPIGTVGTLIHRGKKQLRDILNSKKAPI